jgi:hypothetical protein
MSSARVQKYFSALPDQIKRLGGYTWDVNSVIRWQGTATAGADIGRDAVVIDLNSATWADNAPRAIIVAIPASDLLDQAVFKTQSHAQGQYIDGSVKFRVHLESLESMTDAQAKFQRILFHALLGQLGAPVELMFTANDTEPTVEGVNGAVATAAATSAGTYLPYGGVAYPGGI